MAFSYTSGAIKRVGGGTVQAMHVGADERHRNRQTFLLFFNTHFTNRSLDERNASAMLLLDTIPEIVEESPFILAGDFNAGQNSEPYKKLSDSELLNDSYYMTENRYNAAKGTTNQYNPWHSASRIDHVFLPAGRSDMKVESWSIIIDNFENRLPSDHYPVIIELSFSKD